MSIAIITGTGKVSQMIAGAPEKYRKAIVKWLYQERDSFVGSSKKDGTFRKKLLRKKTLREKAWSLKVVRLFRGILGKQDPKKLNFSLDMGILYNVKKPIHTILENMREAHTISSSKFMPIPIAGNIDNGVINTTKNFKFKLRKNQFKIIFQRGKILYVDRRTGKLEYAGVKKIRIKKQFNFERDWDRRKPKALQRFEKAIERVTKKVENNG